MNVPDRIKAAEDVTFDGEKVPLIHNDDDLDNISNEQGVTNPKQLLNNGRETVLEESITSASGLRNIGLLGEFVKLDIAVSRSR